MLAKLLALVGPRLVGVRLELVLAPALEAR